MARILLCDPREEQFLLAKAQLEQDSRVPFKVDWESSITGAGEAIRTGGYDVCVIGEAFANGRWTEVTRYTTNDGRRVPVILLQAGPKEDFGVDALSAGASDVLQESELTGPRLKRAVLLTLARRKPDSSPRDAVGATLTGEALVEQQISSALARARRNGTGLAVLVLSVAEMLDAPVARAQPASDAIVGRVRPYLRDVDILLPLGTDHLVLIEDADAAGVATRLAYVLLEALTDPLKLNGMVLNATASAGVARYPDDGADAHSLLVCVRQAVKAARRSNVPRLRFCSDALDQQAARIRVLQDAAQGALERAEFELHYQPQLDLVSGQLTSAEALLRWTHADLGRVSPAEFVPVLESAGLIGEMEKWVLAEACAQIREWMDDRRPTRVNVNLSNRLFEEQDIGGEIRKALAAFDVPPGLLGIEIGESLLTVDRPAVLQALTDLRTLGVSVTVDDFGIGPVPLRLIRSYPVDTVKIDRALVQGVPGNQDHASVCGAIVALGHNLHLTVAAEGIESADAEDFLRKLGCDQAQGYYYAKPMPPDELADWIKTRKRRR